MKLPRPVVVDGPSSENTTILSVPSSSEQDVNGVDGYAFMNRLMATSLTFTVHRSPTVGLGIVMKEALMEDPDFPEAKFPVVVITELKVEGPALAAGLQE